jgi:hypothetical protein
MPKAAQVLSQWVEVGAVIAAEREDVGELDRLAHDMITV